MLAELAVENLGVIDRLQLVLGPGMTALTGETGAGKTLLVEAVDLLVGGRADPGAGRARPVTRRWSKVASCSGDDEIVLRRVIPADGRSRAYVDGRLATATALSEAGKLLVDLHGQHAHQSLLQGPAQRAALDRFGDIDLSGLEAARAELREVEAALADLGGDDRARARELDLLRFQVAEIDAAAITGPDEDQELEAEGDRLGDAVAHREAAEGAADLLLGDDAARDRLAAAGAALADRAPFTDLAGATGRPAGRPRGRGRRAAGRGRDHRAGPRAAGCRPGTPPPAVRAAPEVRRHAGRGPGVPSRDRRAPERAGVPRGAGRRAGRAPGAGREGAGRGRGQGRPGPPGRRSRRWPTPR